MAVGADHERGGYDFDRLAQREFAGAIGRQKTLALDALSLSGGPGADNLPAPGRTGGGPGDRVAASEAGKSGFPGQDDEPFRPEASEPSALPATGIGSR